MAFLALPPLVHYLLPVSSMAPGLIVVCVGVLALCRWRLPLSTTRVGSNGFFLMALALFVVVHFVFAALLVPVDGSRFAGSLLMLLLVMSAAAVAAPVVFGDGSDGGRPERLAFAALLVVAAFGAVGAAPPGADEFLKPVFPFTEPSLFGLAFLPLLAFMCVTSASRWKRYLLLAIGLAVAFLLQNLTLVVGLVLVALISAPIAGAVIFTASAVLAIAFVDIDLSYYLSRLDFGDAASNLSSLVYIQGWQLAAHSLEATAGWGLGFQQLGGASVVTDASDVIFELVGGNPNLRDGGFLFSKLVSEFGVFGIGALLVHLLLAVRCAVLLRRIARGELRATAGTVFAFCVVFMYLVEVYVRSAGYFVGTGALLLAALLHLRGLRSGASAARPARMVAGYADGLPAFATARAKS